jgi:hypothetical protein
MAKATAELWMTDLGVTLALGVCGVSGAWFMRRYSSGRGSARRVREFRIGADVFSTLRSGEAVIYTPVTDNPRRTPILPVQLPDAQPVCIDPTGERHPCEIPIDREDRLLERRRNDGAQTTGPKADDHRHGEPVNPAAI